MIQFSDSPCAEKMMTELGKQNMQNRLNALGLTDTSMARLQTSTKDASLVTSLVNSGTGLSQQSTSRLRSAMLKQQYRDALPRGFTGFEVGDKVGFYETGYHDTAFVKAPNSNSYIVTIFTDAVRSTSITELSKQLAPLLRS
jgi:beta-lactamase class A